MKKILFIFPILACAVFMISCGEDEEKLLENEWILVEQLLDPGDGSGVYEAITSDKIITLSADSTFTSNGDICSMSIDGTPIGSAGTFNAEFILPDSCDNFSGGLIRYELSSDELILLYPCIEPCGHKYVRN